MSIQKITALAFVSVLLAGCGGGANLKFEEQLKSDLAASEAEAARLKQDLVDALEDATRATEDAAEAARAATAASMRADAAEKRAADAEAARDADVERYRKEAEDAKAAAQVAQQEAAAANARADAAEGRATAAENQRQQLADQVEEAQQQASSLEASQRAKNLLAALPDIAATAPTGDSPVTISVPSRGSLTFAQGGRSVASLSTPLLSGERGARLTRTRGGTDTTVVYTNRELSRELLDHYADAKSTADAKQLQFGADGAANGSLPAISTNFTEDGIWKVSHGFSSLISASATGDARAPSKEGASFGGSLHGIPGQFLCEGTGCMITLTSAYNLADAADDPNKLNSVTMAVSSGATLYFKPSSASASIVLGPSGIQGRVADDSEYMTFGWWGHEPAHVNGTYTFSVFSDVIGTSTNIAAAPGTGTAEYDGTAVGLYVEQDATTARQGEFTAEVRLTANLTDNEISGEIDNFQTTPRGGSGDSTLSDSWVVELVTTSSADGVARIRRTGSTSTGAWSHEFVPKHGGARSEAPSPAVTGTFNTEIDNLLQIVGAYGAELQQQ